MSEDGKQLAKVERAVERAADSLSKQPRFSDDPDKFFSAVDRWFKIGMDEWDVPEYATNSMARDAWLAERWKREPHWGAAVSQMALIDSSRGWTLTGGRNQVRKYTAILHESEDGRGWRYLARNESLSYRTTDIGTITECGREGEGGPLRALFHVDPTRCRWKRDPEFPLIYDPPGRARVQHWKHEDFISVVPQPSIQERFLGLGWCHTSRAMELVKLLYGVLMHDQEALGARMMKGLLLLSGIDQIQWDDAMVRRGGEVDAQERKYFGGVFVLASQGPEEITAKLQALSQLPVGFDRKAFIDLTVYGYSEILAVDPREFWPVSSGSLGTSTETETQHEKAATKGTLEWPHAYQEGLQRNLPESLLFLFDERDARGELLEAEVARAWTEVGRMLFDADPVKLMGLLPQEQVLSLLVDKGVIPPEYTEFEEDAQATDEEPARAKLLCDRALETPQVRRAIEAFPDEPIVRYEWSVRYPQGREVVLWGSGWEARRPRIWRGFDVKRQNEGTVLFTDEDTGLVITEADVDRAIAQWDRRVPEAAGLLDAEVVE